MANERLRGHMVSRGMTTAELAMRLEVDPKTVERWISQDRLPHRRHRWEAARLLEIDEAYLWPTVLSDPRTLSASEAEFVQLYPHRGMVPPMLWTTLLDAATEAIDVLVYSGLFLVDTHPMLAEVLTAKAEQGTKVRWLIGDPDSEMVRQRGIEEGIGEDLAARIRLTRASLKAVVGVPGIEVRAHTTILYNSLYRFDRDLLANMHVYGAPAPQNPVMHLRRVPGGRLFDHFMGGFDQVWAGATRIEEGAL